MQYDSCTRKHGMTGADRYQTELAKQEIGLHVQERGYFAEHVLQGESFSQEGYAELGQRKVEPGGGLLDRRELPKPLGNGVTDRPSDQDLLRQNGASEDQVNFRQDIRSEYLYSLLDF